MELIREVANVLNVKIALIEDIKTEGLVEDLSKPISLEGSPFEQSDIDRLKGIIFDTADDIAINLNNINMVSKYEINRVED